MKTKEKARLETQYKRQNEFIKENYEVEHTLDFETIIEDLAMCRPYKDFGRGFYLTDIKEQAEKSIKLLRKAGN